MSENTELSRALDLTQLDEKTQQIAQEIIEEQDIDRVKDLTALFNLNAQKRNVMRVIKMNNLLDKVTDQVIERFDKRPDNFSNDDLIKYMQVTENAIDKASKNLNLVEETPPIQLMQNNQVNINIGSDLDRDGRERVLNTVANLIAQMQNSNDDFIEVEDITDINEGDDTNE